MVLNIFWIFRIVIGNGDDVQHTLETKAGSYRERERECRCFVIMVFANEQVKGFVPRVKDIPAHHLHFTGCFGFDGGNSWCKANQNMLTLAWQSNEKFWTGQVLKVCGLEWQKWRIPRLRRHSGRIEHQSPNAKKKACKMTTEWLGPSCQNSFLPASRFDARSLLLHKLHLRAMLWNFVQLKRDLVLDPFLLVFLAEELSEKHQDSTRGNFLAWHEQVSHFRSWQGNSGSRGPLTRPCACGMRCHEGRWTHVHHTLYRPIYLPIYQSTHLTN